MKVIRRLSLDQEEEVNVETPSYMVFFTKYG